MDQPAATAALPKPTNQGGTLPRQRSGRVLALQVLYERDLTGHDWHDAMTAHAEAVEATAQVVRFAEACVSGVLAALERIDAVIRRHAPAWPLEQVPAVDRNLLRLAIYELRPGSGTPPKVAINEAVELAKEFGGEGSSRFVNGVLGAAYNDTESMDTIKD